MKKLGLIGLVLAGMLHAQSLPTLSIGVKGDAAWSQDIKNNLIEAISHRVKVRLVDSGADYGIGWSSRSERDKWHPYRSYRCSISFNMSGPSGGIVYAKTITVTGAPSLDDCDNQVADRTAAALTEYFGAK
jgi:hypothetical protein